MNEIGMGLSAVAGMFGLFGGIGLLMWIDSRGKAQERQLSHAERLKALETGQTLPDAEVARYNAEASRAWAAGFATLVITVGMGGVAVGATSLVFQFAESGIQVPLLSVIWGVCGLIALVAVCLGLGALGQRERREGRKPRSLDVPPHAEQLPAVLGDPVLS